MHLIIKQCIILINRIFKFILLRDLNVNLKKITCAYQIKSVIRIFNNSSLAFNY